MTKMPSALIVDDQGVSIRGRYAEKVATIQAFMRDPAARLICFS